MEILNQKKVILVNDETSMRNPDSSSGIYLTAAKVAQGVMVANNRKLKGDKKVNSTEDSHPKVVSPKTNI